MAQQTKNVQCDIVLVKVTQLTVWLICNDKNSSDLHAENAGVFAGDSVSSAVAAAMTALFACEDPATWRRVQQKYWDVVEAKAKNKKPGKLLNLDNW